MRAIEQVTDKKNFETNLAPYVFSGEIIEGDEELAQHVTKPDDRFKKLLGQKQWMKLPKAIRKRFGKRFKKGQSVSYQGIITEMSMSKAGWAFAQAARLIGAPLPFERNSIHQPAVVVVTEDQETNGQFWIRQYGREKGFPQVVHSSKRFAGPTGLEEYIGYGIGMALKLEATAHALFFRSDHYFVQVFGKRIRMPQWLAPFNLEIGHHDLGDNRFAFTLDLKSGLLGKMINQNAVFMDPVERAGA